MCIVPSEPRPHIASQMNWLGVFVKPSVVISVCVRAGGGREVHERAGIRAAVLRLSALRALEAGDGKDNMAFERTRQFKVEMCLLGQVLLRFF